MPALDLDMARTNSSLHCGSRAVSQARSSFPFCECPNSICDRVRVSSRAPIFVPQCGSRASVLRGPRPRANSPNIVVDRSLVLDLVIVIGLVLLAHLLLLFLGDLCQILDHLRHLEYLLFALLIECPYFLLSALKAQLSYGMFHSFRFNRRDRRQSKPRRLILAMATWALNAFRTHILRQDSDVGRNDEVNVMQFLKVRVADCALHKTKTGKRARGVQWTAPCTCIVPESRSGHRIITDGKYLYVIGGYNPNRDKTTPEIEMVPFHEEQASEDPLLREVWAFNLLAETWTRLKTKGTFPYEMASFSLCADASFSRLYMFGGTGVPFGNSSVNKTRVFHLRGAQQFHWDTVHCDGTFPTAGYGQAMVHDGKNCIYVVGGTTGFEYNMRVSRLQLSHERVATSTDDRVDVRTSGRWTSELNGEECDNPRYRHEAFLHNNRIVIFGGGTRDMVTPFDKLDVFEIDGPGKWQTQLTHPDSEHGFPEGRRCHAAVLFDAHVYVMGGCSGAQTNAPVNNQPNANNSLTMYNDVWKLCLSTWTWTRCPFSLEKHVYFHSATVTEDGCVFLYGGVLNGQATRRSSTLYRLWLRPPSLRFAAAQALLRARPAIRAMGLPELLRLGVPTDLAQWLSSRHLVAVSAA